MNFSKICFSCAAKEAENALLKMELKNLKLAHEQLKQAYDLNKEFYKNIMPYLNPKPTEGEG